MATDYIEILKSVVFPLVKNPEGLLIRSLDKEDEDRRDIHLIVCASNSELGKLIGKKGAVADAIRTFVNVKARDDHKRVHIKFEAFDEDDLD